MATQKLNKKYTVHIKSVFIKIKIPYKLFNEYKNKLNIR